MEMNNPTNLAKRISDYEARNELAQIFARKFIVVRKRRRSARR